MEALEGLRFDNRGLILDETQAMRGCSALARSKRRCGEKVCSGELTQGIVEGLAGFETGNPVQVCAGSVQRGDHVLRRCVR